jgi:hypothetical protein
MKISDKAVHNEKFIAVHTCISNEEMSQSSDLSYIHKEPEKGDQVKVSRIRGTLTKQK